MGSRSRCSGCISWSFKGLFGYCDSKRKGQGGTASSIQRSMPYSDLNPLDQQGTTSNPSDQGGTAPSIQISMLSSDLNPLDQQGTTSNPSDQGGIASSSSVDSHSQSSPSSLRIFRYDVFISFRGPDTRDTFVDHLYAHLDSKGIFTFKDDKRLEKGESISPQLLQAIKDSRISIVVFSKTYAESTWCLDEMATIAECRKELEQTVFPVFYGVDPSDVRKQNGMYENAFVLHTEKFKCNPDKVKRWKRAMTCLAELAGWDVRNKPEVQVIENIVQAVIKTLGHKFSGFADDLIGIQPRIEELEELLKLSSHNDDFRVLGIWGIGGIGKTTHATVLYDRISYQFDACCFIENVSKIYEDGGAIAVQKQILQQTIDEKNLETYTPSRISGIIRDRLHKIKILIVLDNVDRGDLLEKLAIDPKSLRTGSIMIITARDKDILKLCGAHKVHEVQPLNYNDAHLLFCKKAFRTEVRNSKCVVMIPEILQYAQSLPLAIKVLGSSFYIQDGGVDDWKAALKILQENPGKEIMDVLQVSFDRLEHKEKEIFLHIACFFKGERDDYVKRILDACGLHSHVGIRSMIQKSLITVRNQEIHMHDMLQQLGKKIVRHHYPGQPRSWSRLWLFEDFYHASVTESGTDNVEAIVLDQKENLSKCTVEGLSKMTNLRLLILHEMNFSGRLNFLSNNLHYLLWHGYPFPSLPSDFEPFYLVELNMPHGTMQQLWKGRKHLPYLKRMDLSNSKCLKETPSFESIPKLERLDLSGCTNLLQVHPSIKFLTKLAFLNLRDCSSLVSLDFGRPTNLSSLKVLQLSGCSKLENTFLFWASNLEYLDMDRCTSLSTVHKSILALTKLRFLSLRDCTNLVSIPISNDANAMISVINLNLCGCSKLENLPLIPTFRSFKSLISMDLSFCNLLKVPDAIGELRCLERLNLQGNNFDCVPSTIMDLDRLAYLNLAHCHELKDLSMLPCVNPRSGGMYFKTESGSRDHRSGLYIFDCPNVDYLPAFLLHKALRWLQSLLKQPHHHFRCGFDIVVPCGWENIDSPSNSIIPKWFEHRFDGGSIMRIMHSHVDDNWMGFAFCVAFEVNNGLAIADSPHHPSSSSPPPLPHPFYLSFESEHTEERFDFPLGLELDKIDGSKHLWIIYISREHCHFVNTGALITFKARPGLIMKQWGLHTLTAQDIEASMVGFFKGHSFPFCIVDNVKQSSHNFDPKIQLPYNWFVSDEDEVENNEAKRKEFSLSNLGLEMGQPQ